MNPQYPCKICENDVIGNDPSICFDICNMWSHIECWPPPNIIVDLLRKSKKYHYRKYFEDNKRNCKAVRNGINEIIYSKSKVNSWESNCILLNGRAVIQPKDIAKNFNDYFTSISKELQNHIPPKKRNFSDNLKNPNAESLFMAPRTPEEISWYKPSVRIKHWT